MHARQEIDDNARRKPSSRPKPGRGPANPASALLDMQHKLGNAVVADMIAQRSTHNAPPVEGAPIIPARAETAGSEHGDTAQRPAEPAAVQRWAFVNDQKKAPDELSGTMKKLARDELVHDYLTEKEFERHAAGDTKYLGNLSGPSRIWVRFREDKTNVLGEQHDKVTLPDVLKAVGSKSFAYERFPTESFSEEPNTEAAYRESIKGELDKFGVPKGSDLADYGVEQLYPKLGYLMSELFEALNARGEQAKLNGLAELSEAGVNGYMGGMIPRSLKIAWKYGKDMRDRKNQEGQTGERARLVEVYSELKSTPKSGTERISGLFKGNLNRFIERIPDGGHIGDVLREEKSKEYWEPLRKYLQAFISEIWVRGGRERLPEAAESREWSMGRRMYRERDSTIREGVLAATERNVLYVGVGDDHRKFLAKEPDERWKLYDMVDVDIKEFADRTTELTRRARSQQ